MLSPLVHARYYPDFRTPAEELRGLPAGLEALLSTPVARLRTDMTRLARLDHPLPAWTRRLAEGDRPALERELCQPKIARLYPVLSCAATVRSLC